MTAIIILAAGSSSRLGQPKQNLIFRGQTLLQRAIDSALSTISIHVLVVLGADADLVKPTIDHLPVTIVHNPEWKQGISSSIKTGVEAIEKIEPNLSAVIIMPCDQPFIDTHLLNLLILQKAKTGIAASFYNEELGLPILFNKKYFPDLLILESDNGIEKLLEINKGDVSEIYFPWAETDIDTMADFEKL